MPTPPTHPTPATATDLPSLLAALDRSQRVLLTTHVRPDGDALGSVTSLALALRSRGKVADILLLSKLPTKYRFVLEEPGLPHTNLAVDPAPDYASYDTLIVADTGTFSQLPGLETVIPTFQHPAAAGGGGGGGGRKAPGTVLIIDHHKTQEPWGNVRIVDTSAASATELIGRILSAWKIPLSAPIAEALYIGIVSDTGWFAFSNTTPSTLRLAADLMHAGVNPDRMYQRLFQSEREPRLRLQARVQNSFQLLANGRLAVLTVRASDFIETHAAITDTENLINFPLQLASVEMCLLLTETPPPDNQQIKISCRSKGSVDVAKFAEQFGGGGHARASGLKLPAPLDTASQTLITAALATLK